MIEVRTVRITWFVETGYVDGSGVGYWSSTKESAPCATEAEAHALRDEWITSGKLKRTQWGELRPDFSYGIFRIRAHEEIIERKEADQ
jgi:hypothetical protein